MTTTTMNRSARTDRTTTSTEVTAAAGPRAGGDARAGRAGRTAGGAARSWAPVWVRPVGAVPAVFRRAVVPPTSPDGAATPVRLDEATRRLLRVPSLVAETAQRLGSRASDAAGAPERVIRRRPRRVHTRRPASGLLRVTPALGAGGGCDAAPRRSTVPSYRMSRAARLSLTITVVAAVVVMAANAMLSSGPTTTTQITVTAGDTLWSIAQDAAPDDEVWSVIDEISALNGLTGTDVVPGQVLTVPVG
ncbi:LysM peptidoglycan-binding domain-containing protein [Nakamurella deserti]|uniref:LysM peptidoglycan-binding domain-containing protein n=1 Tax=Nakamurella deserti TaxID=2164074 RepID=UPI000DBE6F2A|nr:LysM peptidoglycan-binding domain-containing protein [Nakamurella deserti]